MSTCRTYRSRGTNVRPLRSAEEALAVAATAAHRPERAETICLVADERYLPLTCLVVDGGGHPDAVLEIAELIRSAARGPMATHVVIVSVRPHHPFEGDDLMRWHELDAVLSESGSDLMEWFVVCQGNAVALTPLVGEPPRWPQE